MKESTATGTWKGQTELGQQNRLGMRRERDWEREKGREEERDKRRPRGQREPREKPRQHVAKAAELYRQKEKQVKGKQSEAQDMERSGVRGQKH